MSNRDFLLLEDAVPLYLEEYLAARNSPPLTRTAYRRDLTEAVLFLLDPCGLVAVSQVEERHLERFLGELDRRGLSGSYRRRKVAAIRSFFSFLTRRGFLPESPAAALIPPERELPQLRYLSKEEYTRLRAAVAKEPRDAAVIELLLQTGMLLSEVSRLKLTDVELPETISQEPGNVGRARIVRGKARKDRTVTLNWKACQAISSYLAVRRRDTDDPSLFLNRSRRRLGPRAIERLVAKHLKTAGIHGASVHSLRHTFGTHQVIKGTALQTIEETLGNVQGSDATAQYVDLARQEMDRQLQEGAL